MTNAPAFTKITQEDFQKSKLYKSIGKFRGDNVGLVVAHMF